MAENRNAFLCVHNRKGIETLARGLVDMGYQLFSTGATAEALLSAGLPVVTARNGSPDIGTDTSLLIVNLNPFEYASLTPGTSIYRRMRRMDLMGISLIRTAVSGLKHITVVCSPDDYETILWHIARSNEVPMDVRLELAVKAMTHCIDYDSGVLHVLNQQNRESACTPQ